MAHKDEGDIHSDLQTKMRLAHQDESAFHSVWKMVKFEEVFPDKTGTVRSGASANGNNINLITKTTGSDISNNKTC